MFILSEFKDVVRTSPAVFDKKLKVSVTDHLNSKLANKVVPKVGLCITLFDIQRLEDSYIFPGDGAAHTKVEFRFVVFRPFIDEIIIGKIRSCTKDGVQVTLGFFDDILIPPSNLQHPSRFDETEQVWVWEFDNDGDKHDLFMDPGEKLKFRVTSELFVETSPVQCPDNPELPDTINTEPKVPYSITATINEPGLGVLSWWDGA
ncbi:DNA-directed RNA polymerase III subunit RPC8-like [Macrosteles quadrilineatus]|uniref:DNA-directed RNA polymerase III subunit RPC8-like n=1 Tax=Macrosteles quadrilineatus TaxID=74068 RepID=UPI0023E0ED6D|nr:DNA-directed RNA polymerase III subunit RPC8-like [Macrosteles quadrilineatus]XP_054290449.1 DNA-directed RNA polymerase III subunit RPC8-like [Macrosteles quadrilineatus]